MPPVSSTLKFLSVIAVTAAVALPGRGQTAPDLSKPAPAADDTVRLDRFVVTDPKSTKTVLPVRPVTS
ncbi:MAG: hypothetical protein NTV51_24965, partial [Verrucomicrobia bacterium]|nr:hypothetical protein [Verrucomicrobiota bacterium]